MSAADGQRCYAETELHHHGHRGSDDVCFWFVSTKQEKDTVSFLFAGVRDGINPVL